MLKALIRTRLQALFSGIFRRGGRKKKASVGMKVLLSLLMFYIVACFFWLFGGIFTQICRPFFAAGIGWFYFGFAGLMAFALMFIGSVFATQTQIYEAKDNDLLLSMPIPPSYILISRMLMLLIMNLLFELLVVLPAVAVYIIGGMTVTFVGAIIFAAVFFLLPLLSFSLSGGIGWMLAVASSKVRNKSLVTTVLSLLFLAAYFYLYSRMNEYIKTLIVSGTAIASKVRGAAAPVYWLGSAIAEHNGRSLLLFALCSVVPFLAVTFILAKSFIKIATERHGSAKIIYRERTMKVSGQKAALLKRELRHFVSSPMYMMNAALGVVFIVIAGVLLIIKKDDAESLLAQIPGLRGYVGIYAVAAMCLISCTNIVSAPSVSLEGKSIWIVRSMPVPTADVLMAKVWMHVSVCLPAVLFTSVTAAVVLKLQPVMMVFMIITPALMTVFGGLFGVAANLKFPKMDWISETVAVKQSISVILSMFGTAAAVLLPGLAYIFLASGYVSDEVYTVIFTSILIVFCLLLYRWISTKGTKIFENL